MYIFKKEKNIQKNKIIVYTLFFSFLLLIKLEQTAFYPLYFEHLKFEKDIKKKQGFFAFLFYFRI